MKKYVNGILTDMTEEEIANHLASLPTAEELEAQRIERLKQDIEQAVQKVLDDKAQELRYDNINSIAKYLGYDNPFRAECEALGAWTASVWAKVGELEATGTEYTVDEVVELLPKYN